MRYFLAIRPADHPSAARTRMFPYRSIKIRNRLNELGELILLTDPCGECSPIWGDDCGACDDLFRVEAVKLLAALKAGDR
ncbi:hypothetical protein [Streptomyces sp. NPDC102360]|uniref:hypothetical protein n=1 Tax=Streptomyces sp. NPDC102360 TaxID=3366160 RepID=UPI0037FBBACC